MNTDHTPPAEQAAPTDWIDGHPQLEAIAAAVWEQCGRSDSGMCVEDDPRNIAVAALAAVLPPPVSRADVYRLAAKAVRETIAPADWDADAVSIWNAATNIAEHRLRRMADEAQPDTEAAS